MPAIDTLVIGAGQAGLAMSRCLTDAAIDHAVLERGRLGERWRSERWDSLRLLTPNWATRLPGWAYQGDDPSGFMTAAELVDHFERYADSFEAPVHEGTSVTGVRAHDGGFVVETDDRTWRARRVVIATGWCDRPYVPAMGAELAAGIEQRTPSDYRNPDQLPAGGVLVVGASASGVQLADELRRTGREVVLAVGQHNRLPRSYRGLDIWWWLDRIGTFSRTIDELPDPEQARREGSLQLVGRDDHRDIDLPSLQRAGVRLTGRLSAIDGGDAVFAPDLAVTTAAAERRLRRVLGEIDQHIASTGLEAEVLPATEPAAVVDTYSPHRIDLARAGISTVIWATGFTRRYPWLHVPVLDAAGEIRQQRGVTPVPGVYVLGQRFQHRRDGNFIDGVRHDAAFVADHITGIRRQPQQLAS
jgi:putative flavoprotein involved in K+ transport